MDEKEEKNDFLFYYREYTLFNTFKSIVYIILKYIDLEEIFIEVSKNFR